MKKEMLKFLPDPEDETSTGDSTGTTGTQTGEGN